MNRGREQESKTGKRLKKIFGGIKKQGKNVRCKRTVRRYKEGRGKCQR